MTAQPATRPPCGDADIVDRLRAAHFDTVTQDDLRDAADEIVRLRQAIADERRQLRVDLWKRIETRLTDLDDTRDNTPHVWQRAEAEARRSELSGAWSYIDVIIRNGGAS